MASECMLPLVIQANLRLKKMIFAIFNLNCCIDEKCSILEDVFCCVENPHSFDELLRSPVICSTTFGAKLSHYIPHFLHPPLLFILH